MYKDDYHETFCFCCLSLRSSGVRDRARGHICSISVFVWRSLSFTYGDILNRLHIPPFSGLVVAIAMLPWCIFMGATYPFMMAFLEEHYPEEKNGFSFLYLANVIGAMTGTLFTALFLIEIFGFQNTLLIAACMNFTVTILAVLLGISFRHNRLSNTSDPSKISEKKHQLGHPLKILQYLI